MRRTILICTTALLAVLLNIPVMAQAPGPPKIKVPEVTDACRSEMELGNQLLAKEDTESYHAAAESFRIAVEAQYNCVPALIGYTQAVTLGKGFQITMDEYMRAYEYISRALVLDPRNSRGYWVMADLMRHTNRPQMAIVLADRSLVINPDDPWGHYVLGSTVIGIDTKLAIEEFEKSLALRPGWNAVRLNLAAAYITEGMLKKAREQLELYLEVKPDDEKALTNIGIVHYMLGDMEQAGKDFARALEIKPGFPHALKGLGDVYLAGKEYSRAAELYLQFLDMQPRDVVVLIQLGKARHGMGDVEKARESYRKALALSPGDEEAKRLLEALPK